MFELSNELSYGGRMIRLRRAEPKSLDSLARLGSCWVDVPLCDGERHWCHHDRQVLERLLATYDEAPFGDLFIISPFRDAVAGARAAVAELVRLDQERWTHWANDHIGTVHTFQGREADTVVLLLCASRLRPGARDWAAQKPNLLNVAVTRARERLIVIGNRAAWSAMPFFSELERRLPANDPLPPIQ